MQSQMTRPYDHDQAEDPVRIHHSGIYICASRFLISIFRIFELITERERKLEYISLHSL